MCQRNNERQSATVYLKQHELNNYKIMVDICELPEATSTQIS